MRGSNSVDGVCDVESVLPDQLCPSARVRARVRWIAIIDENTPDSKHLRVRVQVMVILREREHCGQS